MARSPFHHAGVVVNQIVARWGGEVEQKSALTLAAGWELIENSAMMIERYRTATAKVGYFGDSIANSLGDILSCVMGFQLARWTGWKWALVVVAVIEAVLLFWIRDNLLLAIIMPIWLIEAIKQWQLRG